MGISSGKPIQETASVSVGMSCGCLLVLDEGGEYPKFIDGRIHDVAAEKEAFIRAINDKQLTQEEWYRVDGKEPFVKQKYIYKPDTFAIYGESVSISTFDNVISRLQKKKDIRHYKCRCKKCGKIRYYSAKTLQTQPKVCFKPVYCSSRVTYSTRANNANYRKRQRYKEDESVYLVNSKDELIPSEEFCDSWNKKRKNELEKQAERDAAVIAAIPRRYAKNYDIDFVGIKYESYEILECINENLESTPIPHFNQRHQKHYDDITVYKEYRCKCYLCGKERHITCDKFGIYPPTPYGYRAYNGYWSEVYCDCHPISSFQWIVNDILLRHGVEYRVETPVEGVYGIDNATPLRFDFAVYKRGILFAYIECQGEQHYKPIEDFGGEDRFAIQRRNDDVKRRFAKEKHITLIEISYKDKQYEKIETILKEQHVF